MIKDDLGVSKNYVFQPLISRKYLTDDFPLIDVSQNIFVYENNYLYSYRKNNSQLLLDSSKNIANFEMRVDSDETFFTNSKFGNIYYKEITYKKGITNFNRFTNELPVFSSVSPDAKQFLTFQNLYILFFKETLTNYPDKYSFDFSYPASNSLWSNMNLSKVASSFLTDWDQQKIFVGYGKLGGNTSLISNVSVISWNDASGLYFVRDLSGGYSFGYDVQMTKDHHYLLISEPRFGVSGEEYFQGAIHIYEIDGSGGYIFKKTIRSKLSNIGIKMKISNDNKKLISTGYTLGKEMSPLIIWNQFLTEDNPFEIKVDLNVYDMCFIGNSNTIMVEEKIFYSGMNNQSRFFYLLEEVNQCENIITRVASNHPYFVKDLTLFELRSFGLNYILLIGETIIHLVKVDKYRVKYLSSLERNKNSKIEIAEDGRTLLETIQNEGQLQFYLCW
jgi:hypothetical protein